MKSKTRHFRQSILTSCKSAVIHVASGELSCNRAFLFTNINVEQIEALLPGNCFHGKVFLGNNIQKLSTVVPHSTKTCLRV